MRMSHPSRNNRVFLRGEIPTRMNNLRFTPSDSVLGNRIVYTDGAAVADDAAAAGEVLNGS